MARAARKTRGGNDESVTGYFRRIFLENPKLLKTRSNDEMLRRWLADHPGETEVPNRVKVGMANAKSDLRKRLRKRSQRKALLAEANALATAVKPARPAPTTIHKLEILEEEIDDCLSLAKSIDRTTLEDVIKLLHHARNRVVWKLGQ
jgi:hypothetical protein